MLPAARAGAGAGGATPWMASSTSAASVTLRHIGPAVSWVAEIGMMPARLTRPTVGLIPTSAQGEAGQGTDPSVSVPIVTAARLAAAAAPDPEDDPQALRS